MTARGALGQPLDGVRVLSLAEQYPGPLASFLLAELGADVVLVERPQGGDPQRTANPWLFRAAALGKRSVALDLKRSDHRAAALRLAGQAQVVLEGYRPGVAERLGIDYDALAEVNPALVYVSISGYGQDGPYRAVTGHNINYEAVAGVLDPYAGPSPAYRYFPSILPVGDLMSGVLAALGIVAALRQAEQTGRGSYLDLAIADSLVLAMAPNFTRALNGDEAWSPREAAYGLFACKDGTLALGVNYEGHFWAALCDALGLSELRALPRDERFARADELRRLLAERLARESVEHWLALFAPQQIPASRVAAPIEVPSDPQLRQRGLFVQAVDELGEPFAAVRSPYTREAAALAVPYAVPPLGAHTADVLREVGFLEDEVRQLLEAPTGGWT